MTSGLPGLEARWTIHEKVRYRRVLDDAVVIHQERAEALVISESEHAFLESCKRHMNFAEIIAEMLDRYEVDNEQLASDLANCIGDMEAREIIHPVDSLGNEVC